MARSAWRVARGGRPLGRFSLRVSQRKHAVPLRRATVPVRKQNKKRKKAPMILESHLEVYDMVLAGSHVRPLSVKRYPMNNIWQ